MYSLTVLIFESLALHQHLLVGGGTEDGSKGMGYQFEAVAFRSQSKCQLAKNT